MDDRSFQFAKGFVKHELNALIVDNPNAGSMRIPVEFMAITRLFWGQHAILADLEAEANWHRVVFPLFSEPTSPPPSASTSTRLK